MKRTKKTVLFTVLLALSFLILPFASNNGLNQFTVNAASEEDTTDYSTQYVVLSLEGFTLGQGYYIYPTKMSYEEIQEVWAEEGVDIDLSSLTAAQATYAFFKEAGIETEPSGTDGYNDSNFYLTNILDIDKGYVTVPEELLDAYERIHGEALTIEENADDDLGSYDYFYMGGWMNSVDNALGDVGAGSYILEASSDENTYVIRWQYTLADYGGDLGFSIWGSDELYYDTTDKSELYILYADNQELIDSDEELKAELLEVMTDLDATAEDVEAASEAITDAVENSKIITLTEENTEIVVADAVYTGEKLTPEVTVKVDGEEISSDNYTLKYKKNTNAGTGYVTVTGTGSYDGSVVQEFKIKKATRTINNSKIITSSKTFKVKIYAKGTVTYKSSNKNIATVNKNTGKVTTKKTGKVKITVKASATKNYKSAKATITVIVVPKETEITSLTASESNKLKVEFDEVSGASGYQIAYSTSAKFDSVNYKNVKGASNTAAVLKNLKKGKTYYVKVRAYKTIKGKKYYGEYGDIMEITL